MFAPPAYRADALPAPPLRLHDGSFQRTDANCPVHVQGGRLFAFMSHYQPIGHSYRRVGRPGLAGLGPLEKIRILDDPDPASGKWLESTWRDPSGRLHGWYHCEELVLCPHRLYQPHIGAMVSEDEGLTWRVLGELLRAPAGLMDKTYRNGFHVGGYGDFCVLPDREGRYLYLHFSSYVADEAAQGVAVGRFAIAARDAPASALELWRGDHWAPVAAGLAKPIWGVRKGWRHPDPDAFWGPAIHWNRDLGVHVMLLNRTRFGTGDIRQNGIYVSFNPRLDDPAGWSAPQRIIDEGVWYPQVIGLGPEDGDTIAGNPARLFVEGFSAWELMIRRADDPTPPAPRPHVTMKLVYELFPARS
ncbi:MAG: hypothetical protein FJX47_06705 [Alphaproteobacteria bacterium]|nr:hypothetical protein [Alphaproteobacteria bacterium]